MKKKMLMAMAAILGGVASAAPGFVRAVFTGMDFNVTSDIWSFAGVQTTLSVKDIYVVRDNSPERTTFAYGTYMLLDGNVDYYFAGEFDDYVAIKIDDRFLIPKSGTCGSAVFGVVRFETKAWHKMDFRCGNNLGPGGVTSPWEFGGIWIRKGERGVFQRLASNAIAQTVTERPVDYCPTEPIYAYSYRRTHRESDTMSVTNVLSTVRKSDPTILDVVYKVTSKKPTVKVRVLAFEDGVRSFAKVVRPETFVDGTEVNVGDNVTPNVEHTISWRVSSDWKTKLAKVKFEVLACEGELLPLELMTIPASDQYGKMKISWNAISESQWFDALLWLYADKDASLTLSNGSLRNKTNNQELANGVNLSGGYSYYDSNGNWVGNHWEVNSVAPNYIFNKMGYSILTGAPLTYANSETRLGLSPSGARQYAYKIVEE